MQVYGLFYEDIDWKLVCLFQNYPTTGDLRQMIPTGPFFQPDEEWLKKILEGERCDYELRLINVIQNEEV
jgi:hypothetical protein